MATTEEVIRSVFTEEDCRKCDEALRGLNDIIPLLDKMKACKVDCEDIEAIRNEVTERLLAWKREFFDPMRGRQ